MKIYFSGSISGGREHSHIYEMIIKELNNYGEVLTEHIGDKSLSNLGENKSSEYLYNRDISFIIESDVVIADITTPSLGVGYEIAYAEKLNKKIYCLYHQVEGKRISAMIEGNPNCKVLVYKDKEEIPEIVKSIFK
ncbi:MAG: nucleoside 2-deoxyribosyltransferase [Candidatus Paceibacterota bacterium]|jgi:nucleoside 2-deoxyribosyltransferase